MSDTPDTQFAVDTGGTFTDVVSRDARGELRVTKLLSSPADPSDSIERGVRALLASSQRFSLTHGTTVATNALLERQGAYTALVTTSGFEDVLALGRQQRPELYALHVRKIAPLIAQPDCYGVKERVLASGDVLTPLDFQALDQLTQALLDVGYDAVAICLLHAYVNPVHEQRIAAHLRKHLPGCFITASSEIVREFREYERASTVSVNAYVGPVMARYLARLSRRLPDAQRVEIFESSGTRVPIARAESFPVHTALSGPAGGVVGALAAAQQVGISDIITFDMGGTSTDVALCRGVPTLRELSEVGGSPLQIPTLDIHTVGAGGGSIATRDEGGALKVGPQSAGALPGPACYGRGGTSPTVTDAHVALGRLRPAHFLGGEMSLDVQAAHEALIPLAERLALDEATLAQGILKVADAAMARAIKVISLERGEDPRDFTLVSFGGAGGLHACRLAAQLGIRRVLIPQHPGLLSAYGMLHAERTQRVSRTHMIRLDVLHGDVAERTRLVQVIEALREETRQALDVSDGVTTLLWCDLRYMGQSFAIKVACDVLPTTSQALMDVLDTWRAQFEAQHERLYGWTAGERGVELVTLRCAMSVVAQDTASLASQNAVSTHEVIGELEVVPVCFDAEFQDARVITRDVLVDGHAFDGPAVVVEYSGTTIVPPGWRVEMISGHMLAHKQGNES